MLVRKLDDVRNTDSHKKAETWDSVRMLLAKDGMGFGFHITTMYADTETKMQYLNHLECVYCIAGEAEIEDVKTGARHVITAGSMYALNEHDSHVVRCKTDFVIACVFNPGLIGNETHDASGAYPASA